MGIQRVRVYELKENMVICENIFSCGALLVCKGTKVDARLKFMLQNHQVSTVLVECRTGVEEESRNTERVRKKEQFREFSIAYEKAETVIGTNLKELIYQDKELDIESMLAELDQIASKTDNSFELFEMIHSMMTSSDEVYVHSINVALIAKTFGEWLQLSKEEIEQLQIAGIVHDIGKMDLPDELLHKEGKFTPKEYAIFKKHPTLGFSRLKNKKLDHVVKTTTLMHHERGDGTGYPMGCHLKELSKITRILSIVDEFDNMSRGYSYQEKVCPFEIIRMFETLGNLKFDSAYMNIFLANISDVYINYEVELNNGQQGKIIYINKYSPSKPTVQVGSQFVDLTIRKDLFITKLL